MIPSLNQPCRATTPPLTELQRNVAEKLTATARVVAMNVLLVLMRSKDLSPKDFIEMHVTPRQAALSELDERVSKFFSKIMVAIDKQLDQEVGLLQSFKALKERLQDEQIREKLVKGIALPRVIELVNEFDSLDPSIIDDINKTNPELS